MRAASLSFSAAATEPIFHSRGSSETDATCSSTRNVSPYLGCFAAKRSAGESSASQAELIATSESDFVHLIIPRSQISRHDQSAGGILFAIDTQDGSGKIAEQGGAFFVQ